MGFYPTAGTNPATVQWLIIPDFPSRLELVWADGETVPDWSLQVPAASLNVPGVVSGQSMTFDITEAQAGSLVGRDWVIIGLDGQPVVAGRFEKWVGRGSPPSGSLSVVTDGGTSATITVQNLRGPEGPPGAPSTVPGPPGAPTIRDVLANRPLPSVGDGALFGAVDDNGGTLQQSDGTVWAPIAASVGANYTGPWRATPTSIAVVTAVGATAKRVVELTTPPCLVPARPISMFVNNWACLIGGADANRTSFMFKVSKDGGATWRDLPGFNTAIAQIGVFNIESFVPYAMPLPKPGATGLDLFAPGDTIQVGAWVLREAPAAAKDVTMVASGAPYIEIR